MPRGGGGKTRGRGRGRGRGKGADASDGDDDVPLAPVSAGSALHAPAHAASSISPQHHHPAAAHHHDELGLGVGGGLGSIGRLDLGGMGSLGSLNGLGGLGMMGGMDPLSQSSDPFFNPHAHDPFPLSAPTLSNHASLDSVSSSSLDRRSHASNEAAAAASVMMTPHYPATLPLPPPSHHASQAMPPAKAKGGRKGSKKGADASIIAGSLGASPSPSPAPSAYASPSPSPAPLLSSSASPPLPSPLPALALAPFQFASPKDTPYFARLASSAHAVALGRSLGAMGAEDLAGVALELGSIAREARERLKRVEANLLALDPSRSFMNANASLVSATRAIATELPSAEVLGGEISRLLANALAEAGLDSSAAHHAAQAQAVAGRKRAAAAQAKAHRAANGSGGEDDSDGADDGYGSDDAGAGRPKKKKAAHAMSDKERQRQLTLWAHEVEEHFAFPQAPPPAQQQHANAQPTAAGAEALRLLEPVDPAGRELAPFLRVPPLGDSWRDKMLEEKAREEAPSLADQMDVDSEYTDGTAAGKKKRAASAPAPPAGSASALVALKRLAPSKRTLAQSLSILGLDDARLRRSVGETDKALGGDGRGCVNASSQTLAQRVLSMLIELPAGMARPPATVHPPLPRPTAPTAAKKPTPDVSQEKRIELELKALGLLQGGSTEYNYSRELSDRTDDELSASLRAVQKELVDVVEQLNAMRAKVYPTVSQLTDHTARMHALLDAEAHLVRAYQQRVLNGPNSATVGGTGKKKSAAQQAMAHYGQQHDRSNEVAIERALHSWEHTMRTVGPRQSITGFIANPVDLGGIPRWRLGHYPPARGYLDVFQRGLVVPEHTSEARERGLYVHNIPPQHPHNIHYQHAAPPSFAPAVKVERAGDVPVDPRKAMWRGQAYTTFPEHPTLHPALQGYVPPPEPKAANGATKPAPSAAAAAPRKSAASGANGVPPTHHGHAKHAGSANGGSRGGSAHQAVNGPPSQRGGSSARGSQASSRVSSSSPSRPAAFPPHSAASASFGQSSAPFSIGALPPMGRSGGYDDMSMDSFLGGSSGFTPPHSPTSAAMRRGSSNALIGQLPPSGMGIGQLPRHDPFGLDDF